MPSTESSETELLAKTYHALANGLRRMNPKVAVSEKGYVLTLNDNLSPGVLLEQFEEDLNHGDGNELKAKFLAAHSSSALAVNSFAPFKARPGDLQIAGTGSFNLLKFERQCPTGLRGGTPPNLDLVCESDSSVVAIESKCTEYLHVGKPALFSEAYDRQIVDERRSGRWFKAMDEVASGRLRFNHLDVAQLIKHSFGVARCFPNRTTTLLYLFWEPLDAAAYEAFVEHRTEIARFAETVGNDAPKFRAMSYAELWASWTSRTDVPSWLSDHVSNLRKRYSMSLQDSM